MPKQPFLFIPSGDAFAPIFSGFAQSNLAPSLGFVKDGSGYRVLTAADFASATITGTVSGNFTNNVRQVGITGLNGTAVDVVVASGFNAIPVVIASGNITSTSANPVVQVGITGLGGTAVDVTTVSGFKAFPVFIVSGQGGSSAGGASSNVQGVSGSGVSGNMPNPVLAGAWVNPITSGTLLGNTLQALQLDNQGNLYVSLGTSLSSSVDSISVAQTGAWTQGITGSGGNAVNVVSVSGFNAFPVFLASGNISSTSSNPVTRVGITGTNGVSSVVDSSGRLVVLAAQSGAFQVQGVSGSGVTGNMPNPVLGGAWVNPITSGIALPGNTLQALQLDTSGNLWVNLGTALTNTIDSIATSPKTPLVNTVYQLVLTGVGVFNNYTSIVPNLTGSLSMSVEPHSSNNQPIYYSFSGGAVTGQAWELRGDRTFELNETTGVFFAQATGSQIVCFHVQTF